MNKGDKVLIRSINKEATITNIYNDGLTEIKYAINNSWWTGKDLILIDNYKTPGQE